MCFAHSHIPHKDHFVHRRVEPRFACVRMGSHFLSDNQSILSDDPMERLFSSSPSLLQKRRQPYIQGKPPKEDRRKKKQNVIEQRLQSNLIDSKYRMLNELLYTTSGEEAYKYFSENQKDFQDYHEGYRLQIAKWPVKPVEVVIQELEENTKLHGGIVCDLGCGDGGIFEHFRDAGAIREQADKKVKKGEFLFESIKSFDLVAAKPFVQVADMSKLPLKDGTSNVNVFCLSLMGTNYLEFLLESHRTLKKGGYLVISEVLSRFRSLKLFVTLVKTLGYKLLKHSKPNSFFVFLLFRKVSTNTITPSSMITIPRQFIDPLKQSDDFVSFMRGKPLDYSNFSQFLLKPCVYKKR
eukprot:TRINITY_DN4858_c0_g2_i2.p1 TRINITY_DN4858_c0_g2~~TRINITY_DN4858_c0_g2_i2.p1  ORF type:complete len:352 (+),score=57.53 TRINITY_DN4858_c0_g2_i2:689-1744(+)